MSLWDRRPSDFLPRDDVVPEGWGDGAERRLSELTDDGSETEFFDRELVIDRKSGRVRQAGASDAEGQQVIEWRGLFERSLYHFTKGVLGRRRLTRDLHYGVCEWLTSFPPTRKLFMLPRDHYKTTVVNGLVIHLTVQPKEGNVYIPGTHGVDARTLLGGESEKIAMKRLRWIKRQYESNARLRGLWPHVCWPRPSRDSDKWTEKEILLPRNDDSADQSIEAAGIGSTVTGGHYDVLVKDDLATDEAANSHAVMQEAKDWHTWSRALTDDPEWFLEFIAGTHWGMDDLYVEVKQDPSVDVVCRSIVEPYCVPCDRFVRDGEQEHRAQDHEVETRLIMPRTEENPKGFTFAKVEELRREFGVMFNLLFMNDPTSRDLSDFVLDEVRTHFFRGDRVEFSSDERDEGLRLRYDPNVRTDAPNLRGRRLTAEAITEIFREHGHGRDAFLRLRYA